MSQPALTPKKFVEKWASNTLNEKAVAQTHFNELCAMLGIPAPNDNPATQADYRFEQPLAKSGGGAGFADVWHAGKFVWEYKSKGKNLEDGYRQLLLYKGDLGNPPIMVVCDIGHYLISIEFTGTRTRRISFTNADLINQATRDLLRDALTQPEHLRPTETRETITQEAARTLVHVARLLEQRYPPEQVAHFFMKLLFTFFAEDIHLLPQQLLTENLRAAISDPPSFVPRVNELFSKMQTGGFSGSARIPHFDGGLFDATPVLELTADEIQLLTQAAKLDWSAVEPSIFGTLFERALDPAKRSQLGAHYTSEADIRLIVEPVLMQPLRREWAQGQATLTALEAERTAQTGAERDDVMLEMRRHLLAFMRRLRELRVLDPACGSGNFLYVALKQMKDLEQEVVAFADGLGLDRPTLGVEPTHFYGIEQNPFAAELAQVVLWIGYWQWRRTNGYWDAPEPILQPLTTIEQRDAILSFATDGTPTTPAWPPADVIIGNPPFLGGKMLRRELDNTYVNTLFQVYAGRVPHEADLVSYWFEQAREQLVNGNAKRVGLLATQSIRAGANREVLKRIKQDGDIFMAWADRPWLLDGAAVRVSMVGFDDGTEQELTLNGLPVTTIYANLTSTLDLTDIHRLPENANVSFQGDIKVGAFNIPNDIAQIMLAAVNPSGRDNADVIVRWINGLDVVRRPRNMWIIDFGVDMSEVEAQQYELPYAYLLEHVRQFRAEARSGDRIGTPWWLHLAPRPEMRAALAPLSRFVVTPRVARHRLFVWVTSRTLPDNRVYAFAREDDYFFGVLHSHIHEVWALATSSRHGVGNDPTYNNTTCFETFPFPYPPGQEPPDDPHVAMIGAAAAALDAWREAWLNPPDLPPKELAKRTLTNLYNARPDDLVDLHSALDAAVAAAYGWKWPLSDDDILTRLLALNGERG
ncbi:MAG: class I SAM-dependent DNA methyltransferase [Chloroflexaceae bacterium]|nr:class I SAM-dependent DNA methyltransferase [Chloroflexaceae bacterium]